MLLWGFNRFPSFVLNPTRRFIGMKNVVGQACPGIATLPERHKAINPPGRRAATQPKCRDELSHLIDLDQLRSEWAGQKSEKSERSRGQVGVKSGRSRPSPNDKNPAIHLAKSWFLEEVSQNANLEAEKNTPSYLRISS